MKKQLFFTSVLTLLSLSIFNSLALNTHLFGAKEYGPNELSSNLINNITQDSYGFIWVATGYGLNKFDGIKFTQYLNDDCDTTSLVNNNVNTLKMDSDSILWLGTKSGLQCYDPASDSFCNVTFKENESPHITCIEELADGELIVTTSGWGLYTVNRKILTATPLKELTDLTGDFTGYVYEDKLHFLWVSVNGRGLVRINPITMQSRLYQHPEISHNNITEIIEDNDGTLYVCTSVNVEYYDRENEVFNPLKVEDPFTSSLCKGILSQSGNIILSTDGSGLRYIESGTKTLFTYPNQQKNSVFSNARISSILEDRDQNLWLGCFLKGIIVIPNKSSQFDFWKVIEDNQMPASSAIVSVSKDTKNNIWCCVDRAGMFKFNEKGEILKHYPNLHNVMEVIESSDNKLWAIYNYRGLAQLDENSGEPHYTDVWHQGYMKTVVEGSDKKLYISTFGHGVLCYDPKTGESTQYSMNQYDGSKQWLDNDWVNSILSDSKGNIWFGHYKGVSCLDTKTGEFTNIENNDKLSKEITISLLESKNGMIWAGTYNGLFCINPNNNEITRFTMSDGLSSNVICGLAEDGDENIWCSTFKGINQIKPKESSIINYYSGNGLVDKTFNRGVYFQDSQGRIYFGGNSGITTFLPQNVTAQEYLHEVITTNVYVHSKPTNKNTFSGNKKIMNNGVLNADRFRFSYGDNSIAFEFSTMDYIDPENIYYEYRLKELGDTWNSTLPGIGRITYNYLNPGKYTLEVRACKYGNYTSIKQLGVTISPPWYRSTIAYFAYLLLFITIGMLVTNLIRRRRNEKINETKLQFFINISHDIRSPLTLIISPLEKLLKGDFDPETMRTLQSMHRSANRILGLVNQLLDIRKFDKGQLRLSYTKTDMVGFVDEVLKVFEYQAYRRNINLEFQHNLKELESWVDRRNFDKILMNVLSNAFKYTPDGGEIVVTLDVGVNTKAKGALHNFFEINIIDSGIGLKEDKTEKIFDRFYQSDSHQSFTTIGSGVGLNLTKILVELHHGEILAKNRDDVSGSCFTIRIPLNNDHLRKEQIVESEYKLESTPQRMALKKIDSHTPPFKRRTNHKVLVVDDEQDILEYLNQELGKTYKVLTASDGEEAYPIAITEMPDVIISDVLMPNVDGFELVKKLKSNSNVSHIPVILLTSKIEQEDRIQGLDEGADAYITKPFSIDVLAVTINNLIESRQILKGKFSGAQEQEDKVIPIDVKSDDEIFMERVMNFINDNISNSELSVEMLAQNIGVSRVQLYRKLKELTGISAGVFIRDIRLRQAATLLADNKMNISQVAYTVGFNSQAHFSTVFKKFYGVTPTEYIEQNEDTRKQL